MTKNHKVAIQCLRDKIQHHRESIKDLEVTIEDLTNDGSTWSAIDLAIEAMREFGGDMSSIEIYEKIKTQAKGKLKLKSLKTMLSKEAKDGNQIEKVKGRTGIYQIAQAGK